MLWASLDEIDRMLRPTHWLRGVIQRAEILRRQLPEGLRDEFRANGFEI